MLKKIRIGVGVMVMAKNKVLLGKRIGKHEPGKYGFPGGSVLGGEALEMAAVRELFEETGIRTNRFHSLISNSIFESQKYTYVNYDFLLKGINFSPVVKEKNRIASWDWYEIDNLPNPMFFPAARSIKAYLIGKFQITQNDIVTKNLFTKPNRNH